LILRYKTKSDLTRGDLCGFNKMKTEHELGMIAPFCLHLSTSRTLCCFNRHGWNIKLLINTVSVWH